jgi:DNA-directed RNA polymerase subunit RPC12/RpoP
MHRPTPTELIIQSFHTKIKNLCARLKTEIKEYITKFSEGKLSPPCRCPYCNGSNEFMFHSNYYRNLRDIMYIFKNIPIQRYKCLECGRTFANLPDFIKKWYQYAKPVIIFTVNQIIKKGCEKIHDIFTKCNLKEYQPTQEPLVETVPIENVSLKNIFKKISPLEIIPTFIKFKTISIKTLFGWKEKFRSVYA